jgi:hypothetical protein
MPLSLLRRELPKNNRGKEMTDIVLNGVSITELKKQKVLIQQDAAKFIANGIKDATTLLVSIIESFESDETIDRDEIEAAASAAVEILENVDLVAGVSDVEYYLPFFSEYSDDRAFSNRLEELDRVDEVLDGEYLWRNEGPIGRLYGVLSNMENKSKVWNTSYC